jgi:hypothetical protein
VISLGVKPLGSRGRSTDSPGRARRGFAQAHAAPAPGARLILADQFDSFGFESFDHLHQRLDHPAHDAIGGFHPLNRRQRHARALGELPLVETEKGPCSTKLACCYNNIHS